MALMPFTKHDASVKTPFAEITHFMNLNIRWGKDVSKSDRETFEALFGECLYHSDSLDAGTLDGNRVRVQWKLYRKAFFVEETNTTFHSFYTKSSYSDTAITGVSNFNVEKAFEVAAKTMRVAAGVILAVTKPIILKNISKAFVPQKKKCRLRVPGKHLNVTKKVVPTNQGSEQVFIKSA